MSADNLSDGGLDTLIADYEYARDNRNRARYIITGGVMVIVFFFIWLGYQEVKLFKEEGMPEFGVALSEEASYLAPDLIDQLNASVNRLVPVYTETFYETIETHQDKFLEVLIDEYYGLQQYAQESWPEIEMAMAVLVVDQEQVTRDKLLEYVSEEKLVSVSEAYRKALTEYMTGFFERKFGENMLIAESIVEKLQGIADSQEDIGEADTQFILGMLIELLGVQMQVNSAGHDAVTQ